jgi:putative ABC transport system ATP-binding protein
MNSQVVGYLGMGRSGMVGSGVQSAPPAGGQPPAPGGGREPGAAIELDNVVCGVGATGAGGGGAGGGGAGGGGAGGDPGVMGVSLRVPPGQSLALLSKPRETATALFDVLAGLSRPRAGQLRVDGVGVHKLGGTELNRYRAHRGLISPRFPLLPSLSVIGNVLAASPAGRAGRPAAEQAARLLELTGAGRLNGPDHPLPAHQLPAHQLTGEEQWRVMIARALMPSPRLVLAEDPAPGLDSRAADRILDVLVDVHAMFGFTLVLISGRQATAARCQRRVLLANGAVAEDEMTGGDDPWTRGRVDRIG